MSAPTQWIRLKAMEPNKDRLIAVPEGYIVDETLGGGPFQCRTDDEGFIRTGNPDAGGTPLVFLGGSFVESMFAPEEARFVSGIERRLDGYECLNGGYSGASTLHLLNTLLNKVYPIVGTTGAVVFFVGQSDADSVELPDTYWNGKPRSTPIQPLRKRQHQPMTEGLDATRALTHLVVDACDRLSMNLILAVGPYRLGDFSNDQVLRRLYKRNADRYAVVKQLRGNIGDVVRSVASARGVPVLDSQKLVGGDPALFYDELHLNERGQEVFADRAATELKNMLP